MDLHRGLPQLTTKRYSHTVTADCLSRTPLGSPLPDRRLNDHDSSSRTLLNQTWLHVTRPDPHQPVQSVVSEWLLVASARATNDPHLNARLIWMNLFPLSTIRVYNLKPPYAAPVAILWAIWGYFPCLTWCNQPGNIQPEVQAINIATGCATAVNSNSKVAWLPHHPYIIMKYNFLEPDFYLNQGKIWFRV